MGKVEGGPRLSACFYISITVESDLRWDLHVLNEPVPRHSSVRCGTPTKLCTISDTQDLLLKVNASSVCIGNPDLRFREMVQRKNQVIMNRTGV